MYIFFFSILYSFFWNKRKIGYYCSSKWKCQIFLMKFLACLRDECFSFAILFFLVNRRWDNAEREREGIIGGHASRFLGCHGSMHCHKVVRRRRHKPNNDNNMLVTRNNNKRANKHECDHLRRVMFSCWSFCIHTHQHTDTCIDSATMAKPMIENCMYAYDCHELRLSVESTSISNKYYYFYSKL